MMRLGSDDLSGAVALEERRQQLAVGEIAGTAENDQLKGIDGNGLCSHEGLSELIERVGGMENRRPGQAASVGRSGSNRLRNSNST